MITQTFNLTLDDHVWRILQEKLSGWDKEAIVKFALNKLLQELQGEYGVTPEELWQYAVHVFNETDESANFATNTVTPLTFETYA